MFLTNPTVSRSVGRSEVALRGAIVAAAAVGAAFADTAPTGRSVADVVWRALLAAVVTAAGLTAGPVARIMPALVAAAVFAATESWVGALLAAALLLASAWLPPRERWTPAASAAMVGAGLQLLYRLPSLSPDGVTALLATAAGAVVLVSGWRGLGERSHRIARRTAWVGAGVLVVTVAPFLAAAALAWGDIGEGVGEANAWRVATGTGEADAAAAHLGKASDAFGHAEDRLDGWWNAPARFVPILSQHVEAAEVGVRSGRRLVESAQAISAVADPKDMKLTDGTLDLDLVASVRSPLADGRAVLATVEGELAGVDTRWLVPFVQDDVDRVLVQVQDARADADLAARVLDVVPDLLGGSGPRRYFVIFSSPAETRELGGFLGNWGILTADDGRIDLEQTGRAGDLNDRGKALGVALREPETYPARYVQAEPHRFWQNVTSSPDLPTVARAVADLYEQMTSESVDGVLVMDPIALAALLELTGPVEVPELGEQLTSGNVASFLLRDQYVRFPELGDRIDFLADAADATFAKLTSEAQPGPTQVADVLGPVVRGRHLLFWSFDTAPQPLLQELGLDGALPPLDHRDVLAVARSNMLPNKLDAYVTEDLAYDVVVDAATGAVAATLTATYTNTAPLGLPAYVAANTDGLPEGTSRVLVSVWTPHLASGATLDGSPLSIEARLEHGRNRYLAIVSVPRGETVTLVIHLDGALAGARYELTVVRQPLTTPSALRVTMRDPEAQLLPNQPKATVLGG